MKKTLNIKGTLLDLSTPKVMGIVNLTPDSFYDGGKHNANSSALAQVEKHLNEGATFIDIGGYSTRPGGSIVSKEDEIKRVIPILEKIIQTFPEAYLSIDTFRAKVAKLALDSGAHLINDISFGCFDEDMFKLVSDNNIPYIGMHSMGNIDSMHENVEYPNGVIEGIKDYFIGRVEALHQMGVHDVILDPGFGFGKNLEQNYELLNDLKILKKMFELPMLVGISRKSMIYKLLKTTPDKALNGTSALHSVALLKGADIVRVHDVKKAVECIQLVEALKPF